MAMFASLADFRNKTGYGSSNSSSSSSNKEDSEKTAKINVDGKWVSVSKEQYDEFTNAFMSSTGGTKDSDKALVKKYASIYSSSPTALVKDSILENKNAVVNNATEKAISSRNALVGLNLNTAKAKAGNLYNFISEDGVVTAVTSKSGDVLAGTGIHESEALQTYSNKKSGYYYKDYSSIMDKIKKLKNIDNYDTFDVSTTGQHEDNDSVTLYNAFTGDILGIYEKGSLIFENGKIKADKNSIYGKTKKIIFKNSKGDDVVINVKAEEKEDGTAVSYDYEVTEKSLLNNGKEFESVFYVNNEYGAPVALLESEYTKREQEAVEQEKRSKIISEMANKENPKANETVENIFYGAKEPLVELQEKTGKLVEKVINYGYENPTTNISKPSESVTGRVAKTVIETPIIAGEELIFGTGIALGVAAEEKSTEPLNVFTDDLIKGVAEPFVQVTTGEVTPESATLAGMTLLGGAALLKKTGSSKSVKSKASTVLEETNGQAVERPTILNTEYGKVEVTGNEVKVIESKPPVSNIITRKKVLDVKKPVETIVERPISIKGNSVRIIDSDVKNLVKSEFNPLEFTKLNEIREESANFIFKEPLTETVKPKPKAEYVETTDVMNGGKLFEDTIEIRKMNEKLDKKTIFKILEDRNEVLKNQRGIPYTPKNSKNSIFDLGNKEPVKSSGNLLSLLEREELPRLRQKYEPRISDIKIEEITGKKKIKSKKENKPEIFPKKQTYSKKRTSKKQEKSIMDYLTKDEQKGLNKRISQEYDLLVEDGEVKSTRKRTLDKKTQKELGFSNNMSKGQLKYINERPEILEAISRMSKEERGKYGGDFEYLVEDIETGLKTGEYDIINNPDYYKRAVKPDELNAGMKTDTMGLENIGNILVSDGLMQKLIRVSAKNSVKNTSGMKRVTKNKRIKSNGYVNKLKNNYSNLTGFGKRIKNVKNSYVSETGATVKNGFRNGILKRRINEKAISEKISKTGSKENLKVEQDKKIAEKEKTLNLTKANAKAVGLSLLKGVAIAESISEVSAQKSLEKTESKSKELENILFRSRALSKQKLSEIENTRYKKVEPKSRTKKKSENSIKKEKDVKVKENRYTPKIPPIPVLRYGSKSKRKRLSKKGRDSSFMLNGGEAEIQADVLLIARAELLYGLENVKDTIKLNKRSNKKYNERLKSIGFAAGLAPVVKKSKRKSGLKSIFGGNRR